MNEDVTVVIPWRHEPAREPLLKFVVKWWQAQGFEDICVWDDESAPYPRSEWRKGALVNAACMYLEYQRERAFRLEGLTRSEFVIITDADIIIPGIEETVAAVREQGWAYSQHAGVYRLTETNTKALLAGHPSAIEVDAPLKLKGGNLEEDDLEEKWRPQSAGSPPIVLPLSMALECPMDPRFEGWGGEDHAWGDALAAIFPGAKYRSRLNVVHLYHPPQERTDRHNGSAENTALRARYRAAASSSRSMDRLMGEFNGR